jgi:Ca2+-binding EF-hand superfamily protein
MCDDDLGIDLMKFKQLVKMKEEDAKIVFQLFDFDGSGKIDSYEFICCLALLAHATLEEKAGLVFSIYDFDGSQVLNQDELVVLFRCVICSLAAMSSRK